MHRFAIATLAVALLGGCEDAATEQRLADLEARVEALSKGAPAQAPAAASPEQEKAAADVLRAVNAALDAGRVDQAKLKIAELETKHANTRAFRASQRVREEMAVVGKDAVPFDVEKWFQGSAADADGKATLVVFWETWCPHCKREVPKLEAMHDKYDGKGLSVVGVTRMSKGITEEQVTGFLRDNGVSYPIAYESSGALSQAYAIRGIPAAVVLKGDKVVWRGHPARVDDAMIERWLGS
ncbi:MAG: TlpA disulfide reductase family protein [Myxococcota bacterium]